ncbi:unnamed protein product [Spodoptera littoralis]|uniref:Peptidase M14 domain-containing protein n=1 Tax=Spodoptera littoralis TaxID=7109 RepID=A0A9P0HSV1_SPOLI|nr:unnamed protein product [Spodoptera littoralis]CAH1634686.1 unnamed protein product [Spodoptera littoralis]
MPLTQWQPGDYKVYNIELESIEQQDNIRILKSDLIDFWTHPSYKYGVVGKVMVPPSHFIWFEEKLQELGVNRDVYIEDVYEYFNGVENRTRLPRSVDEDHYFDVNKYHRYDDILAYLRKLHEQSADSLTKVELIEYGVTAQNRPLVYLRISRGTNETNSPEKPIIVIEAATNPRDWVTIPAALNIVENLLKEQKFLDNLEWIVIPVLNPDGYEYTHTNVRLWQKSRSTNSNMGHICPGVNINRNFDYDWQNFDASSSPCSHLYAGVEPFSEIESRMIQDIINKNAPRVKLYMSLQNNGGYISVPWHYEKAASGMFRQHYLLGLDMVKAMKDAYNLDVGSYIFDRISG